MLRLQGLLVWIMRRAFGEDPGDVGPACNYRCTDPSKRHHAHPPRLENRRRKAQQVLCGTLSRMIQNVKYLSSGKTSSILCQRFLRTPNSFSKARRKPSKLVPLVSHPKLKHRGSCTPNPKPPTSHAPSSKPSSKVTKRGQGSGFKAS